MSGIRYRLSLGADGIGDIIERTPKQPAGSWPVYIGLVQKQIGRVLRSDEEMLARMSFDNEVPAEDAANEIAKMGEPKVEKPEGLAWCTECGSDSGYHKSWCHRRSR